MERYITIINEYFDENGLALLSALVILVLGIIVINLIMTFVRRGLKKQTKIDRIAVPYIRSAIKVVLYLILIMSVLSRLGFSMTSLLTLLGTAGLALSLALQGSLSNMVNGVFLMLSKPFARGDVVSIDGVDGVVESIGLIYTKLKTIDRQVLLPNSDVAGAKISDISVVPNRRCDLSFTVSHSEDIDRVRSVALLAIDSLSPLPQPEPAPSVVVSNLAPNGMEMTARVWTKTEDFPRFRDAAYEELKKAFDREGIAIPGSAVDVKVLEKPR